MITCEKRFEDFPAAHRQPSHSGHCALIHGHNWTFVFTFGCDRLEDGTGFVVDFGALKWVREFLTQKFDHTLLLNSNDPMLPHLRNALRVQRKKPLAKLVVVDNCSSEGLAVWVFEEVDRILRHLTKGRAYVVALRIEEDRKNSATYGMGGCAHG